MPLTTGSWEMDLRVNEADANPPLRCTLSSTSNTCTGSAQTTLPAGSGFTVQFTPGPSAPAPAFTSFCMSLQWQDMR